MGSIYPQIFGVTSDVAPAQECARAALVFFFGLLLVRVAGRRAFARWSALDIVVAIVVGSNLSRAITGNAPLFGTLAATGLLMLMHWILARAAALSPAWSRVFEGASIELGRAGEIDRPAAIRHNVTDADIGEALRTGRVRDLEDIRLLVLEPSGKINALT